MYRWATKTEIKEPTICTHIDCEDREKSLTMIYIKQFRIDFVSVGKKEVVISPDLYLNHVCPDCFLKIIQSEINKLDIHEQLH